MFSPLIKQCWIGLGLLVGFFGHGMMMSYSSCLLPGLRAADSPIQLDLDSATWLASGMALPMILSFLITPVFMARFGRRWVYASGHLLLITAWMTIYFAMNFSTLMVGRLVGGLAIASIYCSGCIIVAEYTAPEIRGLFLNLKNVALFGGYIYMHTITNYLHWRNVALLSATPCVVSSLCTLTWPESPSWLASKNRFEESEENFYWFRGRGEKAVKEIESIIRGQKLRMSQPTVSLALKVMNLLNKFKQKNFLQPLAIVCFSNILCETSGRHFFPAYAVDIIIEITNDKANALYYVLGVDIIILISSIVSCILIKVIGRKTLLFFSGISSTLLLIAISLVSLLISKGFVMIGGPWLVLLLVGIFFVLANLGCSAVPFVIYAEIFPLAHRESGAGIGGAFMCSFFFVFLKSLPYMLTYLKLYGTFAVFAIGMTISLTYLYFKMPETRNRTLQEIGEYFDHGRFLDDEYRGSNKDEAREMLTRVRSPVVCAQPNKIIE